VIDVEPVIRSELDRLFPEPSDARASWSDVRARAGSGAVATRRVLRARVAIVVAAAITVLVSGAAIASRLGGFEAWLRGVPGKPAREEAQQRFRAANGRSWAAFPATTQLRELIRTERAGREYVLYGFRSGGSFCLKLAAARIAFQPQACAPRTALANTSAPFVVAVPEHTFFDRAARPLALASFGIAADGVSHVTVEAIDGRHRALVGGNAYLFIQHEPNTGNRVLAVSAVGGGGRRSTVRLPDSWSWPGSPGGKPGGPTRIEARIERPRVGWVERGEKRGFPAAGGTRFVKPDPLSDLAVGFSGLCLSAIDSRGRLTAVSCGDPFERGPINAMISCRVCGEFLELRGVAADGVARVVVFTTDGTRLRVPLRHNLFAGRVARTQFPIRLVGYDARGRVVATQLLPFRSRQAVPARARLLRPILRTRGPGGTEATLEVGPRIRGHDCWRVRFSRGPTRGACIAPFSGSRFAVDLVQPARRDLFLAGRAGGNANRVELRFADGDMVIGRLVAGHFLLAVPAEHLSRRRTRAFVVAVDATGNVRARQRIFFRRH
jgi:hypothetical protein